MDHSYYIVDVFTDKPFNGAQLAVFPDAGNLQASSMQLLARELNLSESVFIDARSDVCFHLRIFSPTAERNFSGHAIIAAAYVLGKSGLIDTTVQHSKITVEQNAGSTQVVVSKTPAGDLFVQFSRPAQPAIDRYVPANAAVAAALSLDESRISNSRYQTLLVSCEQPYLIVPMRSFDAVREATFNLKEWSTSVASVAATDEILLFASKSDLGSSNFHGRLVGPRIGNDEDPPIGSAMPAFAGYLSAHDHVREGTYSFVIDRGTLASRKSVLTVEMVNRQGKENEIRVGGPAVIIAAGKIATP